MRDNIGKFLQFGFSSFLGLAVGFVSLPLQISGLGTDLWAKIAVLQALGLFLGVMVDWGFGTFGPAKVAGLSQRERGVFFAQTFRARLLVFSVVAPCAIALIPAFLDQLGFDYIVLVLSFLIPSLGAGWFFIGTSSPRHYFLHSVLPRVSGLGIGSIGCFYFHNLTFLALCIFGGNLWGVLASYISIAKNHPISDFQGSQSTRRSLAFLKSNTSGIVNNSVSTIFLNMPVLAMSLIAPVSLPEFALADKVLRFGLAAVMPVVQVFQGTGPKTTDINRLETIRKIARAGCAFGAMTLLGALFVIPFAVSFLSQGKLEAPLGLVLSLSCAAGAIVCTQFLGTICLVNLGLQNAVTKSAVYGSALGLSTLAILPFIFGSSGAGFALFIAELTVLLCQIHFLARKLGEKSS